MGPTHQNADKLTQIRSLCLIPGRAASLMQIPPLTEEIPRNSGDNEQQSWVTSGNIMCVAPCLTYQEQPPRCIRTA